MKNVELSYQELTMIRKALHLLCMDIPSDEEERYFAASDLYDKIEELETQLENELEQEEDLEDF
jgi:benzoyl-CoA reductase/2-hydroxyglutaryl-CoA dehydratase subunit BcrC/BadD/HgdB